MIKSNLKKIMENKGIKTPSELATLTGASRPAIKNLYYDIADMYSKKTIEAICRVLECSISDLLEIVPDKKKRLI